MKDKVKVSLFTRLMKSLKVILRKKSQRYESKEKTWIHKGLLQYNTT